MKDEKFSSYQKCPICKEWGWADTHKCPAVYHARPEDYEDDDAVQVYANSPEQAATNYLADRFSDFDYPSRMTVVVFNDRCHWTFQIDVEAVPSFYATEIKREEEEDGEE